MLERLTSGPSRRSGMYDEFNYGYLGFALGPDGRTVYYLTTGPIRGGRNACRAGQDRQARTERGSAPGHLRHPIGEVRGSRRDIPVGAQRPTLVHSIAVARDGSIYALANLSRNGRRLTDLIRVRVSVK